MMQSSQTTAFRRLARLPSHSIAPGEPDIRGWLVIGADGRRVGRVHDVLVELGSLHARHLEVVFDKGVAAFTGLQGCVIPVECLQVAAVQSQIYLKGLMTYELLDIPYFGSEPIGEVEHLRLQRYFGCADRPADPTEFWKARRRERATEPYVTCIEQN